MKWLSVAVLLVLFVPRVVALADEPQPFTPPITTTVPLTVPLPSPLPIPDVGNIGLDFYFFWDVGNWTDLFSVAVTVPTFPLVESFMVVLAFMGGIFLAVRLIRGVLGNQATEQSARDQIVEQAYIDSRGNVHHAQSLANSRLSQRSKSQQLYRDARNFRHRGF